MLYFDVCLVVRCAVWVCIGFLERMCMSVRSRFCHLRCKGWSVSLIVVLLCLLFCLF